MKSKKARPKVLMVGPWPPTVGGVTTFMQNVVSSPLKYNYDFIPFTTSRPAKRNAKVDNYGYGAVFRGGMKRVVHGISVTLGHLIIYPWRVALLRPCVIQVQASDFQAFWEAALYVMMGRLLQRPVVLRIGGSFDRFFEASGLIARRGIRWTLGLSSALIVQSEYWKSYVQRLGHRGHAVVIGNFVPEALVKRRTRPVPAVPRFLLCSGEVPHLKGAYALLDAVRELVAKDMRMDAGIIAATDALRERIASAGLGEHVRTLGFLSRAQVLEVLRETDVFLQISRSEGFPNMLLEAMASGCAAIVTPVGAIPEVIGADGECACIIPADDAAMLGNCMARLAGDKEAIARMGAAAQRRVLARYTEQKMAPALDRAYQLVMRERGWLPRWLRARRT